MCLAVPLKMVDRVDDYQVILEGNGVRIKACIALVPDLAIGDDCLVHAGFVIEKITPDDAKEKLELLEEFYRKVGRK